MAYDYKQLTFEEALDIQEMDIKGWEKVLAPKAVRALRTHAKIANGRVRSKHPLNPYDVFRGQHLSEFIYNQLINNPDYKP